LSCERSPSSDTVSFQRPTGLAGGLEVGSPRPTAFALGGVSATGFAPGGGAATAVLYASVGSPATPDEAGALGHFLSAIVAPLFERISLVLGTF
jgi:hypothetical protein